MSSWVKFKHIMAGQPAPPVYDPQMLVKNFYVECGKQGVDALASIEDGSNGDKQFIVMDAYMLEELGRVTIPVMSTEEEAWALVLKLIEKLKI